MASASIAKQYAATIDDLDLWGRHAYTRSLVVDYAKPWTTNNDRHLRKFRADHDFLSKLTTSRLHGELIAFRDEVAAHVDSGIHPIAAIAVGMRVENEYPMDNRYDEAFVPVKMRVEHNSALGIDDKELVARLAAHIESVSEAVNAEVGRVCRELLPVLTKYAAVLHFFNDELVFESVPSGGQIPDIARGASYVPNERVRSIGGGTAKRVLGRFESATKVSLDYAASGLSIKLTKQEADKGDFLVSFSDIDLDRLG